MHRCFVHLAALLSVLITGCRAQCQDDYVRPLRIRANSVLTQDIYSPRYPRNYPDNENCAWKITADQGYVVHVHVSWIDLEESSDCGFDYISLYDGHTSIYPIIAKICSDNTVDFYSSSSSVYLEFVSDFSVNKEGFHLEYSAVRPSQIPSTSSTTATPWWFTARPSTTSTTSNTDASSTYDWLHKVNTAALIGGLTGGLLLLFVFCALCRYYYSRSFASRGAPRPYYSSSTSTSTAIAPTATPSAPTIYQNNNAVFMVSPSGHHLHGGPSSCYGGTTNLAFSPCGEAPPAYFAVQHSSTAVIPQPGFGGSAAGAGRCPPPPTYSEAMMLSHPPALTNQARSPLGPAPPPPSLGAAPPPFGTTPPPFGAAPPPFSAAPPRLGPALSPLDSAPPSFGSVPPSVEQTTATAGPASDQ